MSHDDAHPWRYDEAESMEPADVVFGQPHVFVGLEYEIHCLGIASHLLLVARIERLHFYIREECLNLRIGQLSAFDAREEPMLSTVVTFPSLLRRSGDKVLRASQCPLNSSISAISLTRSRPSENEGSFMSGYPVSYPIQPMISSRETRQRHSLTPTIRKPSGSGFTIRYLGRRRSKYGIPSGISPKTAASL